MSSLDSSSSCRAGTVLLLSLLMASACNGMHTQDNSRAASSQTGAIQPRAEKHGDELAGGSTRAWLTGYGDLGDNSFCEARLKIPLDPNPAWEYKYSASEVGQQAFRDAIHYDGLLVGSAGSSVLLGLNASNGRERFRTDAYFRDSSEQENRESFANLMFTPQGLLTAVDESGRYYCWQCSTSGLKRLSLSKPMERRRFGFVALSDTLVCSDGRQLCALDLRQLDKRTWCEQMAMPPRGVVANADSILAWNSHGLVVCLNRDGSPRWRSDEGTRVQRVTVAPKSRRAYVLRLISGELICRDLDSGAEHWTFNFAQLLEPPERQRLITLANRAIGDNARDTVVISNVILMPVLLSETPAGLVLVLQSGDVLSLAPQTGSILWHQHLQAYVDYALSLENGILVHMSYTPRLDGRLFETVVPFQVEAPDWDEIAEGDKVPRRSSPRRSHLQAAGAEVEPDLSSYRKLLYGRFVVLDPQHGETIATHVEELPAGGSILPAGGMLIVGAEQPSLVWPGTARSEPNSIIAYNWLEQGAD